MKRKFIAAVFLIVVLVVCFTACEKTPQPSTEATLTSTNFTESATNQATKEVASSIMPSGIGDGKIAIDRKDHSVKNDQGKILGIAYFDLLQVKGNSAAVKKINRFFQNAYEAWKRGTWELQADDGYTLGWLREDIQERPFICPELTTIATVMFMSNDVLSVRMTDYSSRGGPTGCQVYGYTFNLKTGDLVPFTHFAKVNADEFREEFVKFLSISDSFPEDRATEICKVLSPNENHDFTYQYAYNKLSLTYDLSLDYFYDGQSIYLMLNVFSGHALICKWNGKTGNDFLASHGGVTVINGVITDYWILG